MLKGMQDLLAQAGKMQEEFAKMQQELETRTVEGQSGAGMVKVVMNGKHRVQKILIEPSLLSEERAMLEDLIAAAVNDAVRLVEQMMQEHTKNMTSRLPLPAGFKFPF